MSTSVIEPEQRTRLGRYFVGDCESVLRGTLGRRLQGQVQLLLTSPPYPLTRKKSYGNLTGEEYFRWFVNLAPLFADLLRPDGSIVIELGNAWIPGRPVQSLLHLKSLLGFVEARGAKLRLCQQFVCYNPARLPSPAAWVTVRKHRVVDSFTHLWWMAKADFPKANNARVLRPYSKDMRELLVRGTYNNGRRPSQHTISENGFLHNRRGSLPHNVFELEPINGHPPRLPNALRLAITGSSDFFLRQCRAKNIVPHPARMPAGLASFFIRFLTDPGDLVLDPFAGSNTTGFIAEIARRRWVSIDQQPAFVRQSRIRFKDPAIRRVRRQRARRTSR